MTRHSPNDSRLTAESTLVRSIFICAFLILWRSFCDLWREEQDTETRQGVRVDDDWKKEPDEQQGLRWKKVNCGWFGKEKYDAGCRAAQDRHNRRDFCNAILVSGPAPVTPASRNTETNEDGGDEQTVVTVVRQSQKAAPNRIQRKQRRLFDPSISLLPSGRRSYAACFLSWFPTIAPAMAPRIPPIGPPISQPPAPNTSALAASALP
jgi:hypothetical protein